MIVPAGSLLKIPNARSGGQVSAAV